MMTSSKKFYPNFTFGCTFFAQTVCLSSPSFTFKSCSPTITKRLVNGSLPPLLLHKQWAAVKMVLLVMIEPPHRHSSIGASVLSKNTCHGYSLFAVCHPPTILFMGDLAGLFLTPHLQSNSFNKKKIIRRPQLLTKLFLKLA